MKKIEGLNSKEQVLLNVFADGKEHTIRELKKLFLHEAAARLAGHYKGWGKKDVDATAQSYVRNSLRKLVAQEWIELVGRGTYKRTDKAADRFRRLKQKKAA
jgi:nucleoid DNA-binding protein